mmetsp:Transcript_76025/g.199402  ORF Transcript_76025/g.199402 Transcript_76025/m.199402 type:complete len:200 (-) Transcript_76025:82-681(-)
MTLMATSRSPERLSCASTTRPKVPSPSNLTNWYREFSTIPFSQSKWTISSWSLSLPDADPEPELPFGEGERGGEAGFGFAGAFRRWRGDELDLDRFFLWRSSPRRVRLGLRRRVRLRLRLRLRRSRSFRRSGLPPRRRSRLSRRRPSLPPRAAERSRLSRPCLRSPLRRPPLRLSRRWPPRRERSLSLRPRRSRPMALA